MFTKNQLFKVRLVVFALKRVSVLALVWACDTVVPTNPHLKCLFYFYKK